MSNSQLTELVKSTEARIGLLTGGPGTGKSTVMGAFAEILDSAVFVAPTGRAAVRLSETIQERGLDAPCATIHRILNPTRNGHDGDGWGFAYNKMNPIPCKHVICDEASMNDNYIMACLLSACGKDTSVLFVGDPFQLPPVGKGRPFLDMIQSGLIPHGNLTETHRFAGRIATVCESIKQGLPWDPSRQLDLSEEYPENFLHVEQRQSPEVISVVRSLVERFKLRTDDVMRDVQIIVPVNEKSPLSRKTLNTILQNQLNPTGERLEGTEYRVGDKVICLRNDKRPVAIEDHRGEFDINPEIEGYVSNGEIGYIRHLTTKFMIVAFEGHRSLVAIPRPEWKGDISLAYAITCHKSQGGQWRFVVVIADDYAGARMIANRSWWYTAISRAKEICITVGQRRVIHQDCSVVDAHSRRTFLVEGLKERSSLLLRDTVI